MNPLSTPGRPALALVVLLCGCAREDGVATLRWIESFEVGWEQFNHRISSLGARLDAVGAEVVFVGGASTTAHTFDDSACALDERTCWELPFYDPWEAALTGTWMDASALAAGEVTLQLDLKTGEPVARSVYVPLSRRTRAPLRAWIADFHLDLTQEIDAPDACYDPRYGWLTRELFLSAGDGEGVRVDGRTARVSLAALWRTGATGEPQRACLDAVIDGARARVTLRVVVAEDVFDAEHHEATQEGAWALGESQFNPAEQDLPEGALDWSVRNQPDVAFGWHRLHYVFNEVEDPDKGAYLRTLGFGADPVRGELYGRATSYSPVTQLDGFDFRFEGAGWALRPAPGAATRRHFRASGRSAADERGQPLWQGLNEVD